MTAPLQCQLDAARVATTAEAAVAWERRSACRTAATLLRSGSPVARAAALNHLLWSVQRQARMSGIAGVHIEAVSS